MGLNGGWGNEGKSSCGIVVGSGENVRETKSFLQATRYVLRHFQDARAPRDGIVV